jgi:hypothetical protein
MNSSSPHEFFVAGLMLALALVFLAFALVQGRRRRLLDDTPVSKALGVFIGEVQIEGACVVQQPFTSYLTEKSCVLYSWNIQEEWQRWETETYQDKDGETRTRTVRKSGWTTVAEGAESAGFYLKDDTGYLWVRPEGADIDNITFINENVTMADALYFGKGPDGAISDSTGRRRFFEEGLPVGTQLFVHGRARQRQDIVAAEIAEDPSAEMFLISPRQEKDLSSSKNLWYWFLGLLGLGLSAVGAVMLLHGPFHQTNPLISFVGPAFYLVIWTLGWIWMALNSLIGLRNRVLQAQSLIDVQLKRRADLIPALVACLQGYRGHEATVQTMVADLRAQAGGGSLSALKPKLLAVTEQYPDLMAIQSFGDLKNNLIETEDRLALAREYYNNIVTFYNTRLERLPDRYVAGLASLKPAELLQVAGLERAPTAVKF